MSLNNSPDRLETSEPAGAPSRREILCAASAAVAGATLAGCGADDSPMDMGPAATCAGNPTGPVVVTDSASLAVGQTRLLNDGNTPGVLLHRDANGYLALSVSCTHAGCAVGYTAGATSYKCPCHGSQFKLDGTVMNGPATMPLRTYSLCRRADGALVVDQNVAGGGNTSRVK